MESRRIKFALSGSSARKLRRGGTNLLGGRAITRTMFPFVPEELGASFCLEDAIAQGTLPLVVASDSPNETLTAYVQTYLKQEIQAEALVRNLPGFARFLPVAALFHGQTLNVASLARDAGVSRTTVEGYVEILEDTLLATRLRAFEGRLRVRERKHPKLFFFDAGVVRSLKHQLGALAGEERGPLFEGLVFMLLCFYRERAGLCDSINYWAPAEAQTTEVDFLLQRGRERVAVEVKTAKKLCDADLRGLRAVGGRTEVRRRIAVYLGDRRLVTPDGIEVWPFAHFAGALAAGKV
jgi:predicted AAA+ superfamily ATPase